MERIPMVAVLLLALHADRTEFTAGRISSHTEQQPATSEPAEIPFEETIFHYGDHDYDVSTRIPSVNGILSVVPVGQKILIECHSGPKNGGYCIFDTVSKSFDEDIMGTHLVWYNDDITTSVYSFWSEIHTYDGSVIKNDDLAEDAYIYDLAFSDD